MTKDNWSLKETESYYLAENLLKEHIETLRKKLIEDLYNLFHNGEEWNLFGNVEKIINKRFGGN